LNEVSDIEGGHRFARRRTVSAACARWLDRPATRSVLEFLNLIDRQAAGLLVLHWDRWPTAPPKRRADVGPRPYGSNLVAAIV
jgi:hypothetical protein